MLEIALAVIAGTFALLTIVVQSQRKIKELKAENETQATEIVFRAESLALRVNIEDWSKITQEMRSLMQETSIDRIFILNAFNGFHDPRWTTAVFQLSKYDDKMASYIHFGIDEHYVSILKETRKKGMIMVDVSEIPESIIRSVYHTEGVLASVWYFIKDKKLSTGSVGLTYCTFSSRSVTDIPSSDLDRCAVLANQIRGAIEKEEK